MRQRSALFLLKKRCSLADAYMATLISDIIQIPEALLVIIIVYKLSKMETKLAEEVEKSGGNIVYEK